MTNLKKLDKSLKKRKKTKAALADSLGSTLGAGLKEMGISMGKMFGVSESKKSGTSSAFQIGVPLEQREEKTREKRTEQISS